MDSHAHSGRDISKLFSVELKSVGYADVKYCLVRFRTDLLLFVAPLAICRHQMFRI